MQFASPHQDRSRAGGIGLVIGLHVVFIWALANGLIPHVSIEPPHKTDVDVRQNDHPKEPPPVKKLDLPPSPQQPQFQPQKIRDDFPFIEAKLPTDTGDIRPPVIKEGPTEPPTVVARVDEPHGKAKGGVNAAGMLCQTMGVPELPAASVEGLAAFKVLGTVRNGRVVAVDIAITKALSDSRVMRKLQHNIDSTLRNTYSCSSDGQFQQEFVFRLE